MSYRLLNRVLLSIGILLCMANPLQAQDTTAAIKGKLSIDKGTILTGFSVDGITASRDDYNHEFERAFSRLRFNIEGLYFIDERIGIGPILGYEYQFRDFEDPTGFFNPSDRWNWSFLYGVKTGWYIPVKKLFSDRLNKAHSLSNAYLFVDGGVNWLWTRQKIEDRGKFEPENRFGYQIGAGLLLPVGKRISLEWKLGFESRREHYRYQVIRDGEVVLDFNEKKWLQEISLSLGLKVIL